MKEEKGGSLFTLTESVKMAISLEPTHQSNLMTRGDKRKNPILQASLVLGLAKCCICLLGLL